MPKKGSALTELHYHANRHFMKQSSGQKWADKRRKKEKFCKSDIYKSFKCMTYSILCMDSNPTAPMARGEGLGAVNQVAGGET